MTKNERLSTMIFGALAAASIPQPATIEVNDQDIKITWQGEHEGIIAATANVMKMEGLNYDNPNPAKSDITAEFVLGGRLIPTLIATYPRLSTEQYLEAGGVLPNGDTKESLEADRKAADFAAEGP